MDEPSSDLVSAVALINEDTKLATLDLSAADVAVYLRGNTMRIGARLGSLSLVDDSSLAAINPSFKKIISIDDDELADFTYESFDPEEKETFPGVNSLVHLRFASLKVTFLEEPVRELYHFLVKFARMKALYDAASQAAAQKAAEITRMKFDILIRSPVIIFPSDASSSQDVLTMKLGEIYASNSYSGPTATISAGLRGIRLTSRLWYGNDLVKLKIIDDVEISSSIVQTGDIDRKVDLQRPDTAVSDPYTVPRDPFLTSFIGRCQDVRCQDLTYSSSIHSPDPTPRSHSSGSCHRARSRRCRRTVVEVTDTATC